MRALRLLTSASILAAILLSGLAAPAADNPPLRIAHLSDIHACHVAANPPGRFAGDPLARDLVHSMDLLRQAVDRINELRPDAVVVTGDLTNWGNEVAVLREVKTELDRLRVPYCPVLGDHDRPEVFSQVFPDMLDYSRDVGDWRLVALGLRAGRIPPESVAWLSQTLASAGSRKVAILTHRPLWCDPLTLGIADRLYGVKLLPGGADAVLDVLRNHAAVRMVLSGHVHVGRHDRWRGVDMFWAPALVGPPYAFTLLTAGDRDVRWEMVKVRSSKEE